jgi:integrase
MLTAKRIERLKGTVGRYPDGLGLYLCVKTPHTNVGWYYRYECADDRVGREGKRRDRWMGLGALHTFTLKEARQRAREQRQLRADHVDPIDHRRARRAAAVAKKAATITFREAAERYFNQHESAWRNAKHRQQFLSSLKTYARPILDMAVSDIDTAAVLRCIEPHWLTKTETMSRTRGRIERVLDWAKVRGFRSGDNPASWRGHLVEVLPGRSRVQKVEHHPAPHYTEVPGIVAKLREREGVAARALEFGILCAARAGEIFNAVWSEVDLAERVWVVPANRMKGGREHRVALSQRAIDLLRDLPREAGNDHVFIGSRPGARLADQGMTQVLRRIGRTDISVHGLCRACFKTWATERSRFPNEVVELALAHAVGDKTERSYLRGTALQRRYALAEAWAGFISTPATPAASTGGEVVGIRG